MRTTKRNKTDHKADDKADALVQDAEKRMKSFSLFDKRTKSVPPPPLPAEATSLHAASG
jgi:hypothetical protein